MKKAVRRFASALGLVTLFFGSPGAHAFCTEFDIFGIGVNCVDEGHKRVTGYIKPILILRTTFLSFSRARSITSRRRIAMRSLA
jgi:hypothetical protein